jgi:hypothetical protein
MGYKAIAHHRECYKLMTGETEYKRRFPDIRDALRTHERDDKIKLLPIQIYYLPQYDSPVKVYDSLCPQ